MSQLAFYKGWRLHQAVDVYVDAHPQSERFKQMPRTGRRRFAGIIQDIAMDYWLINQWHLFELSSFDTFATRAVAALMRDKARCPERLQRMISSLEHRNWLAELGTEKGVQRAIQSIQKRWSLGHHLEPFVEELPAILEQAKEPFEQLYPALLKYSDEQAQLIDMELKKEKPQ